MNGPMSSDEIRVVLQPITNVTSGHQLIVRPERTDPVKAAIDVTNQREADQIKVALDSDVPRALINVIGALTLLSPKAQQRVIAFVVQHFEEIERV